MQSKHAFVLGSGIAGVSSAEVLARNGWHITLVERNREVGGDASLNTQNWFHSGWLYAALPYDSAMRACRDALQLFHGVYGRDLSTDVVNVIVRDDGVEYHPSATGWFNPQRIHYLYATSSHDLSAWQKVSWKHYLKTVPFRRLKGIGYPVEPMESVPPRLAALMDHWESGSNGASHYTAVRSTDARIETRRVLTSLIERLGDDTTVITDTDCALVQRQGKTCVTVNGDLCAPDLVVLATGKGLPAHLRQIDRPDVAGKIKSICSPIVVLKRALGYPDFIRFTPNLPETLNHIRYTIPGYGETSTIGSYDYFPHDRVPVISPFARKMCGRLNITEDEVLGCYYGTKTEYTGKIARRYNHAIEKVNGNTFLALAGKFSQFPLLALDFAEQAGLQIDSRHEVHGRCHHPVAMTTPEKMMARLVPQTSHVATA